MTKKAKRYRDYDGRLQTGDYDHLLERLKQVHGRLVDHKYGDDVADLESGHSDYTEDENSPAADVVTCEAEADRTAKQDEKDQERTCHDAPPSDAVPKNQP